MEKGIFWEVICGKGEWFGVFMKIETMECPTKG